jgi:hypothetical protein
MILKETCQRLFINLVGKVFHNCIVEEFLRKEVKHAEHWKSLPRTVRVWRTRCLLCGKLEEKETSALKNRGCRCKRNDKQSFVKQSKSLEKGINSAKNKVIRSYKNGAKARELEWDLTLLEIDSLIFSPCHYCGKQFSKVTYRKDRKTMFFMAAVCIHNGIDRKDSNIGYIKDNCVSCCSTCNYAKRDMSYDAFVDWINRIRFGPHVSSLK